MYSRIMVPLDGSSVAEIVLPYAEEIASRFGAELILVSVSEPTNAEKDHLYRSYLESTAEKVKNQLEDWGTKGAANVQGEVLFGNPAEEILQYADKNDVNLIIMGSSGRSSPGPWLLGNIVAKVLRATSKPMLLIRVQADDASIQQKSLIKRILLPLDGSTVGEQAIPYAEALAHVLNSELVLFQAFEPVRPVAIEDGVAMSPTMIKEEEEAKKASALVYLDRVGKALQEKGFRTSNVVTLGSPADKIIDYADANAIDLIAMSTHGRSGIGRWVFGSITDKVLHAGDKPVLAVRAIKT